MTNFYPYFSFSIPYQALRCNDFLQKTGTRFAVKIVQNGIVIFVESSGFVNLDEQRPFSPGLFIDFFPKNCILIIDVSFRTKMQAHIRIFRRKT